MGWSRSDQIYYAPLKEPTCSTALVAPPVNANPPALDDASAGGGSGGEAAAGGNQKPAQEKKAKLPIDKEAATSGIAPGGGDGAPLENRTSGSDNRNLNLTAHNQTVTTGSPAGAAGKAHSKIGILINRALDGAQRTERGLARLLRAIPYVKSKSKFIRVTTRRSHCSPSYWGKVALALH